MAQNDENANLSKTYQKKTDKQHILDNPDTYTGSMDPTGYETYVMNSGNELGKIEAREITIIPGLYKLFDEAIVNCRDHQVRQEQLINSGQSNISPVTSIEINIEDGVISMTNDGDGIDVAEHPEYKIWIPEMIFGHLRTSTNYDKSQKKIVGGKNGFGAKLCFVWAKWGSIETCDAKRKKLYKQEFWDNLDKIDKPVIKSCSKKPYTKISFKVDFERLGVDGFSQDMLDLFKRRVMDVAAITGKKVKVKYNGELVSVKHFPQYIDLFIGNKDETQRIYEESNDRWEYAVCMAPKEEFTQVSFVNGIFTSKGGKHVEYILGQITKKLIVYIKKKKKKDVKPSTIKEQIMLFVRCDIENPSFDSQTKDCLTTNISKFGSQCEVSDKFIEKVAKLGVMDAACALTQVKEIKDVKKNDGFKSKTLRGLPKLVDAINAGTNKSNDCTLILCEGDSAKAGVLSGLSKPDRETIGVFPLKGKLLNVRGEQQKRIADNKEITDIKHILGLEVGKEYTVESVKKSLRYGKVLFMTDQDLDGSHIKGLCINLFDSQWKTLMEVPEFLGFMNTPILKATKGKQEKVFYNDGEYNTWKEENNTSSWSVKYYKGLGTSTSKEFKEYFKEKKIVYFKSTGNDSSNALDKAFNKKRAADRKIWLGNYDADLYLDTNRKEVNYEEFIDKEMIHFSKYDNERSIPCLVDGLKTSLRKILYTVFKRKLKKEIKVAQLSGSVSEISGYHHGEASLNGGIVGMAQNYVGSGNINYLQPNGQFGTRIEGGSDSASERYIFTAMEEITRYIYPEADDKVLKYLDDDGLIVEPQFYVPIVPMILVNGSKGIGTGFSTDIPCYNIRNIIEYLRRVLTKKSTEDIQFIPYYNGFQGNITEIEDQKYLVKGCYEVISPTKVRVTELPVGTWTSDYKKFIEELIDENSNKRDEPKKKSKAKGVVRDYKDMSTEKLVDFVIEFAPNIIEGLLKASGDYGCNGLEKVLKLYSTKTTTNMHMFDEKQQLKLYDSPKEIIDCYIGVRLRTYIDRKKYQVEALTQELCVLSNKARFITMILNGEIELRGMKKDAVTEMLLNMKFDMVDGDYKYLIKMPMDSQTEEEAAKLMKDHEEKKCELEVLVNTSEIEMWLNELNKLEEFYINNFNKELHSNDSVKTEKKIEKKTIKIKKTTKLKINQ